MIMWLPGIVWFIMVIAMVILYTDTHHRKPKPPPLDYFRIQQLEQLIYGETFPCEGAAYVPGKGAPVAPRPVAVHERVKVTDVEVSYRLPIYPRIRYESNVAKLNSVKDGPDVVHNPWQPDRTIDGDVIR